MMGGMPVFGARFIPIFRRIYNPGNISSHRDLKQPATMVAPAVTVQLRTRWRVFSQPE